jgi:hypothetical protein
VVLVDNAAFGVHATLAGNQGVASCDVTAWLLSAMEQL